MTPIRILAGQPTVQNVPHQPTVPGIPLSTKNAIYIHRDHRVEISPDLYLLFLSIREEEAVVGGSTG